MTTKHRLRTEAFTQSVRYLCPILNEIGICWQILATVPNTKFHETPSYGSRALTCGQTDRHDEANIRFFANTSWTRLKPRRHRITGIIAGIRKGHLKKIKKIPYGLSIISLPTLILSSNLHLRLKRFFRASILNEHYLSFVHTAGPANLGVLY